MKFYYSPYSTAETTNAVLAELPDVKHEVVTLNLSKQETKSPDFLAVNPNGRVPALVLDDGTVLWESSAITLFLGEQYGVKKGLFPEAGSKRGEAMKWVCWAAAHLAPIGAALGEQLPSQTPGAVQEGSEDFLKNQSMKTPEMLALQRQRTQAAFKVLNDQLAKHAFLLGDKYSLVDAHMWVLIGWMKMMEPLDKSHHAHVQKWHDRVKGEAAIAKSHN